MSAEQMPHPARQWLQDIPVVLRNIRNDMGDARVSARHLVPFVCGASPRSESVMRPTPRHSRSGGRRGHLDLEQTRA
jgi:hypothetical protein